MNEELAAFETHMDRMERERQAQASAERIEHEKTKRVRWEALKVITGYVVSGIAGTAVVLGVAYAVWLGARGPSAIDELEHESRTDCIAAGGTWLGSSAASGGGGGGGSCVSPESGG